MHVPAASHAVLSAWGVSKSNVSSIDWHKTAKAGSLGVQWSYGCSALRCVGTAEAAPIQTNPEAARSILSSPALRTAAPSPAPPKQLAAQLAAP